jgi:hypothetical protein
MLPNVCGDVILDGKKILLHLAIDLFTGVVLDKQIEAVNE